MRYIAKRDQTENAIIAALRAVGATVHLLDGNGLPDLLVGFRRHTFLLEVKTQTGTLTNSQRRFLDSWRGGDVIVVRDQKQALKAIGAIPCGN